MKDVLKSFGREMTAQQIVEHLREEAFAGLNEGNPEPGVRTALTRLAKAGEITRVSHGFYVYVPTPRELLDLAFASDRDDYPATDEDAKGMIAEEKATARDFDRTFYPEEEPF